MGGQCGGLGRLSALAVVDRDAGKEGERLAEVIGGLFAGHEGGRGFPFGKEVTKSRAELLIGEIFGAQAPDLIEDGVDARLQGIRAGERVIDGYKESLVCDFDHPTILKGLDAKVEPVSRNPAAIRRHAVFARGKQPAWAFSPFWRNQSKG